MSLLAVALWPPEAVVTLVWFYALCSRLLDGYGAGFTVGSALGVVRGRVLAAAPLGIAPEVFTLAAFGLSWFGIYRMMRRLPDVGNSRVIRASVATICAAGIFFEPPGGGDSMRAAFGTIYLIAFTGGTVMGVLRRP